MATLIPYNRRLDGLRALAVVLVMIWHWFPQGRGVNRIANGQIGVDLFFVLSGYLITAILLEFRAAVEQGAGVGRALGHFYMRRSLRLFPLYYAVLIVVAMLPEVTGTTIRHAWPWYALFSQNVWMHRLGHWDGFLAHFWSLAVEEQFYLVWGVVVLAAPRRVLAPLALTAVAAAPAFRAFGPLDGSMEATGLWNGLTPACIDALAIGCLAALTHRPEWSSLLPALRRVASIGWPPAMVVVATPLFAPAVWSVGGRTAVAIVGLRLLFWAVDREAPPGGWVARIFEATPVVEFGRRSYGLYVFHNLAPYVCRSLGSALSRRGLIGESTQALFVRPTVLALYLLLSLAFAFGSWRFFEGPINRLKDRFST